MPPSHLTISSHFQLPKISYRDLSHQLSPLLCSGSWGCHQSFLLQRSSSPCSHRTGFYRQHRRQIVGSGNLGGKEKGRNKPSWEVRRRKQARKGVKVENYQRPIFPTVILPEVGLYITESELSNVPSELKLKEKKVSQYSNPSNQFKDSMSLLTETDPTDQEDGFLKTGALTNCISTSVVISSSYLALTHIYIYTTFNF